MRFSVFAFSLFFILSTTYAHAVAPLIFTAVEGALIRTATGQFIKAPSKKALANFAVGLGVPVAVSYCQKHKEKCKDIVGDVADYLFDDTDNSDNLCRYSVKYFKSGDEACAYFFEQANSRNTKGYIFADRYEARNGICHVYGGTNKYNGNVGATYHCSNKDEVLKRETQKIINHIKENDVDYIINNYGDTINIQQYCSSHACDELTAEFGNEVMNNKNDYDIDKINKVNCEVENNKIKSCENAKKNKEKDEEEDEQETEETEQDETEQSDTTNDDNNDKINCEASEFHKKVCDFIDWYQDDTEFDDDTKVKVNDLSDDLQLKKDRVQFNAQCPPDKTFNMSYAGVNVSPTISYKSLCDGFIMLKPFIIGLSGITAILIIAGGRRG